MSSKNLKLLIAGSMLLTLVSCGSDNKSSSTKTTNNLCGEIDCMSSINWKILLPGKSFPSKSRVDINGTTVLNECVAKQKYSINRNTDPEELYLENFYVPKRGELSIDVSDCRSDESPMIKDNNVQFEVVKVGGDVSEIVINL